MALPNVTAAQLQRISAVAGWVQANVQALTDALTLAKQAATAFAADTTVDAATRAAWAVIRDECTAAINSYPQT